MNARVTEEVERSIRGESSRMPGRPGIQPFLTHKLSRTVNAGLVGMPMEGAVEIIGG